MAIKFFSSGRHANSGTRVLPMREARAASALNHPNIIMIHEVIETENEPAIVMELVSGETLRAFTGRRPRLSDLLDWSAQLAGALAVAHAAGLVHGDIKPENVMVRSDGYVKLLDFGLALAALPDSPGGRNAPLTGTPRYLSPEQCMGQPATPASDIFAFGVMLYELATGQHPFGANGMLVLLKAIISEPAPEPVSINRKLPRALNSLILRMLSKHPKDRPTADLTLEILVEARTRLTKRPSLLGKKTWLALATVLALASAAPWIVARQPATG